MDIERANTLLIDELVEVGGFRSRSALSRAAGLDLSSLNPSKRVRSMRVSTLLALTRAAGVSMSWAGARLDALLATPEDYLRTPEAQTDLEAAMHVTGRLLTRLALRLHHQRGADAPAEPGRRAWPEKVTFIDEETSGGGERAA